MPEEKKAKMWDLVIDKCDISADHKSYVMLDLSTKWRNYRCELKMKYFDPYKTDEERLSRRPANIAEEDWTYLIHLWGSPEFQAKSKRNKANRSKLVMGHCTGRKSYAQIEAAKTQATGTRPTLLRMFELSHQRVDGTFVDIASQEAMSKMKILTSQTEAGSSSIGENEAVKVVLGPEKRGHVRLMGMGPTPTQVYGPQPSRSELLHQNMKLQEENIELRGEMRDVKGRLSSIEEILKNHLGIGIQTSTAQPDHPPSSYSSY